MPVVGFDINTQRILADGKSWGEVGPYEELLGTLHFATDPLNDANSRITDVELAPRSDQGLVEFTADVSIILPVDRARGSGKLLLDVVNRGNRVGLPVFNSGPRMEIEADTPVDYDVDLGNGFLMRHGYTVMACGWQVDTPKKPALITLQGHTVEGMTGRVYTQLQSQSDTHNLLLSDKGHQPYPAADMVEAGASLEVRDMPDTEAYPVPRDQWRFGRLEADGTYVPDPGYICSEKGFEKGRLYQIVYTTDWAPILGLSFAALRDSVSWLKYGSDSTARPIENIRHAYAYGISQTGRYLRTYIYNDFNRDESDREALDGIIANVAGGMRGEFNQRLGQNSKDRNNMMTHLFPFASVPQTDLETEETDSLHRRMDDRGSQTKVMYTNSSAEYYRGDSSLIHTDPDGNRDIEVAPTARIYHFSGTQHGIGTWPPTDTTESIEGVARSQNIRNVIDYSPLLRACLFNLDRWVNEGVEPPPNSHPRIDDGTAVPFELVKKVFDGIPNANRPDRIAIPRRRDYALKDDVEQIQKMPPTVGKAFATLLPVVDADGNEIPGIRLPEVAVPLATHTGWTLRHKDIGGETQLLMFAGATMRFASTESQRAASRDPRPSIAERYASKDDYLERVRGEAEKLVEQRYMLEEDIEFCVDKAAQFWEHLSAE
ncbi:MAG: alpha/beta hydrolase domain-containing protein [SAR202 cluster bacterium]|nr:alpha/beta hydrolase domain-containing protein [SAR202 cluster bacterium]